MSLFLYHKTAKIIKVEEVSEWSNTVYMSQLLFNYCNEGSNSFNVHTMVDMIDIITLCLSVYQFKSPSVCCGHYTPRWAEKDIHLWSCCSNFIVQLLLSREIKGLQNRTHSGDKSFWKDRPVLVTIMYSCYIVVYTCSTLKEQHWEKN
jgi:hypothetical protein